MSRLRKAAAPLAAGVAVVGVTAANIVRQENIEPPRSVRPVLRTRSIAVDPDVTLHVTERGSPVGTPVVLLHGLSDSWLSYGLLLEYLPNNLRLIGVDLRGHGLSSKRPGVYSLDAMANDVRVVLDSLRIPSAVIVGHSLGSLVAQHVAARSPSRVDALVLIGSARSGGHFDAVDGLRAVLSELTELEASVPEAFAREFQYSTVNAPVPEAFMESAVTNSLRLPVRVWQRIVDDLSTAPEPQLKTGRFIPTLLLWGTGDLITPRSEQDALLRKFDARLVAYDSTGHAPHWERPRDVAVELANFISSRR